MKNERITSDERMIMIKEEENKLLDKLQETLHSLKDTIQERNGMSALYVILGNLEKRFNAKQGLLGPEVAVALVEEINSIRMAVATQKLLVNSPIVKDEVYWLRQINMMNSTLANSLRLRGLDMISDLVEDFMDKNRKDLFSVSKLKGQLAFEEQERNQAAEKVLDKVRVKEEHKEPKPRELSKEELERKTLADEINAKFFDLNETKKDLPFTRNTKELSNTLLTRLDKFDKNYKLPLDASRSFNCLRQAKHEIDKMNDELVLPIKEIVNYSAILAGLEK